MDALKTTVFQGNKLFSFLLALVVNDYRLEPAPRHYPNNSGVPTHRCRVCFLKENVLISFEQEKYFPA